LCVARKQEGRAALNHRLEQMAAAIFKSWFVDFEPWGGEQPANWTISSLADIADYLNGLAMQRFRPIEGEVGLPVLKIKELRQGACDSASELCTPNVRPEYIVHDGDIIFSWSGSLLVDIWCGGDCGLNQHLFKVTSRKYDKWFYYLWTRHHLAEFVALAADKATTMGHIKRGALENAEVLIPDTDSYRTVGEILSPLIEEIIATRIDSRNLAALRDSLLPKLMSGELSVNTDFPGHQLG
jgi:type I restriction enzyme S subunit